MKYRIEDIIDYINTSHKYSYFIREQSSPFADYGNEAILYTVINNQHVGIIFEFNPFNPHIYYTEKEMKERLEWLEKKAKTYGGKRTKTTSRKTTKQVS